MQMHIDTRAKFRQIVAVARNAFGPGEGQLVGTQLRCVACGYNLHGIGDSASCPECGTPIRRSLQGDRLAMTDYRWLHTLRLAMLCFIGAGCVYLIIDGVQRLFPVSAWDRKLMMASILWSAWWGQICLRLVGLWLLTVKEPRFRETESKWSLRTIVRKTTLGLVAANIVAAILQLVLPREQLYAQLVVRSLDLVAVAGLYLLLSQLAGRIPHKRMAQTSLIIGGLEILVGLSYLLFYLVLVFTRPATTAHPIAQCAGCAHLPVNVSAIALMAVFFVQFGRIVRK